MTPIDKPVQIEPPVRRKKMDIFKEDYLGMESKEERRQRKRGGVDVDVVGNQEEAHAKAEEAQERGILSELPAGKKA